MGRVSLEMMRLPLWAKILLSILVVEALGGLGAGVTSSQIPNWYALLNQPALNPPNWIFGPVWICLYAMMGTAFALVWHRAKAGNAKRVALSWFGVQLLLNLAWTPVFFAIHHMLAALVIIVLLWGAILMTIRHFRQFQPITTPLLLPYLAWVSFAIYLNSSYWWLNR